MPVDTIATNVYQTLKLQIDKFMNEPPKYEELTLPDGFSCYVCVKPEFSLLSLGYDYTQYNDIDNNRRLKKIKDRINKHLNKGIEDSDDGDIMYIKVVQKNNDYVFVLSLP